MGLIMVFIFLAILVLVVVVVLGMNRIADEIFELGKKLDKPDKPE